jgi:aldehyde dehydrogenase (NAD+)
VPETTQLLELPFDHIFFTGSPAVGKIVMGAAAKNLTSVTLELGGKSPLVIDIDANLEKAADTAMHKKTMNAGQVCICPDYLLIPKSREAEFIKLAKKAVDEMYYSTGKYNGADSTRIVNKRNFDRLKGLFDDALAKGAKVALGGTFDEKNLQIEPTILINVAPDSKIMQEEIFGPILPVLNYTDLHEVIAYINRHSKPLGLYFFSNVKEHVDLVVSQTSSGGVTINETELQAFDPTIPFGGVNGSGMGAYHGIYGFKEFSHQKSVLYDNDKGVNKFMYPPYAGKLEQVKEMGASLFEEHV